MRPTICGGHLIAPTHLQASLETMRHWLMKSEPSDSSIDDLMQAGTLPWTGVRSYQARNFMRDDMRVGDGVLFYHSSCPEPGIAGLARVSSAPYPDATQFDPDSRYFDTASARDDPRWQHVDVSFVAKTRLLSLADLRATRELREMLVLRRGNRLSITPVQPAEWRVVLRLLEAHWPST